MIEWIRFWITAVLLVIGLISFAAAVIGNYRFGYIALLVVFMWNTSPVSSHFLSQIAYYTDNELWDHVDRFKVRSHPESEEI